MTGYLLGKQEASSIFPSKTEQRFGQLFAEVGQLRAVKKTAKGLRDKESCCSEVVLSPLLSDDNGVISHQSH